MTQKSEGFSLEPRPSVVNSLVVPMEGPVMLCQERKSKKRRKLPLEAATVLPCKMPRFRLVLGVKCPATSPPRLG